MHKLSLFLVSLILPVSMVTIASAAAQSCNPSATGGAIECGAVISAVVQNTGLAGSTVSRSSGPTMKYLPYDRLTIGPNSEPCITTGYYEEGSSQPRPPQPGNNEDQTPGSISSVFDEAPPCPLEPRAPREAAVVETPAMIARRYWEEVPLPKPRPQIAPGRAITGKLAYLETRGETGHTYTNNTVFGPLEIVAKGAYTVDWGDGETTGPHAFEGKPWPDGRITHDYLDVGRYDIVVTERWTATWRLGGESGVLRALQTTGRIDDFPVEQIQAVVRQ